MAKKKREPIGKLAVVEESADNIYSVKFVLQSLRYEVESFAVSSDFLSGIQNADPALVVVDMLMPDRTGFGAIQRLRRTFPDLPIVAITADAMEGGDDEDVRKAGASAVLRKPYSVPELKKLLEKLAKVND